MGPYKLISWIEFYFQLPFRGSVAKIIPAHIGYIYITSLENYRYFVANVWLRCLHILGFKIVIYSHPAICATLWQGEYMYVTG